MSINIASVSLLSYDLNRATPPSSHRPSSSKPGSPLTVFSHAPTTTAVSSELRRLQNPSISKPHMKAISTTVFVLYLPRDKLAISPTV
ncbi:hypothetical protein L1887_28388 [Cichorium endivia]|nr:hypothetical protein L1887_28388 [Cichorium endivia]